MPRLLFFILHAFLFVLSSNISAQTKADFQLTDKITNLIVENIDNIKTEYYKISAFKDYPFQTASLFVLGNIMLTSHQLDNVILYFFESKYNPTAAALSKDSSELYRNKYAKLGKYTYALFGNQTNNINFINVNKNELESIFDIKIKNDILLEKEGLLDELIRYNEETEYLLSENLITGFNELGLMQREIMSIPVLHKNDYTELYNVSTIIKDELINLLSNNINSIKEKYNSSTPESDLSFKEYFIYWYQQLATNVINELIDLGYIKVPAPRNFNYIIISDNDLLPNQ